MKILAIETSCDETAVSLIESHGSIAKGDASFDILGNALLSQVDIHKEFGGVYPMLAKREHAKNLVPLTIKVLRDAGYYQERLEPVDPMRLIEWQQLFSHEPELFKHFVDFYTAVAAPDIDAIAVTSGPGLEPALWVGINFGKTLAGAWGKPLVPVNHMEGHILSSLMQGVESMSLRIPEIERPAIALLISGGHTQLVLMRDFGVYELVGETRDDAVGEAFDKVARMLDLPYPGGPEISRLANEARERGVSTDEPLPRPMLRDDSFDFSFSGLKTAVLYRVREQEPLDDDTKRAFARAFEDAAVDILLAKTKRALEHYGAKTLIVGGGVSANARIREIFSQEIEGVTLFIPDRALTTDNALMIAAAAALRMELDDIPDPASIVADGNRRLA